MTSETLPSRSHTASLDGIDISSILANSLTGLLLVDAAGRIRYANATACDLTGLASTALRGHPLDELLDVDLEAALCDGNPGFAHGLALLDGGAAAPIYVLVRIHSLTGEDAGSAVVEMTEPAMAQSTSPETDEPVVYVTATGRIVTANHAMCDFLGLDDEQLRGILLDDIVGFADQSTQTLIAIAVTDRRGVAGSPGMVFAASGPVPSVAIVQSTGDRQRPFAIQFHVADQPAHVEPSRSSKNDDEESTSPTRSVRTRQHFWRRAATDLQSDG